MSKFYSPLKIMQSKVKNFLLNLNHYRNTHYRVLNNVKVIYKKYMTSQIKKAKREEGKVLCIYKLFNGSNHKLDIGNICSVHQKFFEDAFVELGKLPDDNTDYIPLVMYVYGGKRKENPMVEVEVLPLTKSNIELAFKDILSTMNIEEEQE